MKEWKTVLFAIVATITHQLGVAQPAQPSRSGNDVTTPLHAMWVDCPVPYEGPSAAAFKTVLDRAIIISIPPHRQSN